MAFSNTVVVLLVVASTLAGCTAQRFVSGVAIDYVNCQAYGVVSVTDSVTFTTGTVCGTVDKTTADRICDDFDYGAAIDYGTATQKGVSGGTGTIEAMNLNCPTTGTCTFSPPDSSCTHANDLVVKCTVQPDLACGLAAGIIAAIVVVCVFFFLILPLICVCVCCGVCYCMGAACFAASTPEYGKL